MKRILTVSEGLAKELLKESNGCTKYGNLSCEINPLPNRFTNRNSLGKVKGKESKSRHNC